MRTSTTERPTITTSPARRSLARTRVAGAVVGVLGAAAGTYALLIAISEHVASGNSDGATVVLEGQSMSAGHLLLDGWSLSLDSFWTIDALFYAVAVRLVGVRGDLMNIVPSVIATLVVVVACYLASDQRRDRIAALGALACFALLALPSRALALYFLQGPLHDGTLLWCLLAFAALQSRRFGWRYAVAVCLIAAGFLGDLQITELCALPIVATALLVAALERDWRGGVVLFSAPIAGGALAYVVRHIARALGTFAVPDVNSFASGHQLLHNIRVLPELALALLGASGTPFGPTGEPLALELLHLLGLGLVLAGPVVVAIGAIRALAKARRGPSAVTSAAILDYFLFFGFIGDIGTFVALSTNASAAFARYLVCGVVFGAILGCRVLVRVFRATRRSVVQLALVTELLLAGLFGIGFGLELGGPQAYSPVPALVSFLAAHNLRHGVGDYWSASIVTVESGGTIEVRPVVANTDNVLFRYDRQSSDSWYGEQQFNFLVFNSNLPWDGVDIKSAVTSFRQPVHLYAVGQYRVLVWKHPFELTELGLSQ